MRFLHQTDYAMQIKEEIVKLLTAPDDWYMSAKLIRAEQTAIAQIRNRIGKRYNCNLIFVPVQPLEEEADGAAADVRDQWIVTITIDIVLYHLYSQTGMKDIPEHRQMRYQDALDWLKDVGNGTTTADLPPLTDSDGSHYSDFRINSRTPQNWKW